METALEKLKLDDGEVVHRSPPTKECFSLLHSLKVPLDFVDFLHKMPADVNLDTLLDDEFNLTVKDLNHYNKEGVLLFGWVTLELGKEIGMDEHLVLKVARALKGQKKERKNEATEKKAEKKGKNEAREKEVTEKKEEEKEAWKLNKVEIDLHGALVNILVLLNKSDYF